MSVEQVKNIKNAYKKMIKDGSAFKKINMTPSTLETPDLSSLGEITESPTTTKVIDEHEDHTDWSELDNAMQKRMDSLKAKINGGSTSTKQVVDESKEIFMLKKRVKKLEEALMLIMETHEKLL